MHDKPKFDVALRTLEFFAMTDATGADSRNPHLVCDRMASDLNHPSMIRFINDKKPDSAVFTTADGWNLGVGALYHISGDIMKFFDVKLFAETDWADLFLMFLGADEDIRIPQGVLRGWQNTYEDSRVVMELGLHYVFRKFKAKHYASTPPKDFTMAQFVDYINYYATNKSGYCDNKICNYLIESPWRGVITKSENLILYDEPENPINKLGCASPPRFGIPTLEDIAKRVVLDEFPQARVSVMMDDIAITVSHTDTDSVVLDVSE